MKFNKIFSGILLVATSTAFGQNLQNATKNTDNEFFTEADKEFRQLITNEPLNASNYFYLGENFFAQKEIDSAIVYWNKASEKDPLNPLSTVASGKVKLIKGDISGAKALFTQVLTKTKNKNAEVIRMIAKAYLNSDFPNTTETIALLNQAVKVDPKNEFNFLLLGDAYLTSEPINPNEAIKNYNDVLDINPKSPLPNPPCIKLLNISQGVGIVTRCSSLYRVSISLSYSKPMFLSPPAFKALSTNPLIES